VATNFTVFGEPVPWARAGRFGKITFTPKKVKDAEKMIGLACRSAMHGRKPSKAMISMVISFYRGTKRRVDIDNLIKLVLDGLNSVAWVDDAQVMHLTAIKVLGDSNPRTIVQISEMTE